MLGNNYEKNLLKDMIKFYKMVGGADALEEKGFRLSECMDDDYMEELQDLLIEWLPDIGNNLCIIKIDDCVEAEQALDKFFREEMSEILRI